MSDLFGMSDVAVEGAAREEDACFLLRELEVFNWGPFVGKQKTAEVDPAGTAIIGATGSGKTTLIDALMTLLVALPKYNLASTGGHESDRDLVSYVRGVAGAKETDGEAAKVMRPGKTITGLAARYNSSRAGDPDLLLGALLWFEGASNAAADLKKLWFVSEGGEETLTDLLRLLDDGGKRKVKAYAQEVESLDIYDSKKGYLARLRRLFEVGENAFALLNRAAGLKQLNSIDQIFRDLVLDNEPLYKDGLKVAADFDVLAEIRAEVELAKRQRDSLVPVEREQRKWERNRTQITDLRSLRDQVPVWYAMGEMRLLDTQCSALEADCASQESKKTAAEEMVHNAASEAKRLQARYMESGGGEIESLREVLKSRSGTLKEREINAERYRALATKLMLGVPVSEITFRENLKACESLKEGAEAEKENLYNALVQIEVASHHLVDRRNTLQTERQEVERRPGSNIPSDFQVFRECLAEELGMSASELPYVAELVQVKPEERDWQGAIERALGPERLRVFVPANRMAQALAWVNGRNNSLHVRLQRVESSYVSKSFFEDSFYHKLELKEHACTPALKALLHERDRHCVGSAAELERVEHGMTREGTMSGRAGKFDKQDQRRLGEGWVTGFDNSYRLESLRREEVEIMEALKEPMAQHKDVKEKSSEVEDRLRTLLQLEGFEDFGRLDVAGALAGIERINEQIRALESPDSDLAKTRVAFEAKEREVEELRTTLSNILVNLAGMKKELEQLSLKREEVRDVVGGGLTEQEADHLMKVLDLKPVEKLGDVAKLRREAEADLQRRLDELVENERECREKLVRMMEAAKAVDNGALTEIGTELADLGDYLARLEYLRKEDLPERQARFMEYLNKSSGQGVTQLLSRIEGEVSEIEDRITLLNETLGRVEFKTGLYLELVTQKVGSDTLKQLKRAQTRLNAAITTIDDDEGESRYVALKALVDVVREAANNPSRIGSQALLDPRHRLEFSVREVIRETGEKSGKILGSQTGSGGEKEMMASYILTASLSYALCPRGATRPKYATIVLDEAFSKSSQSAATRIIKALREFGLHPLFVTPNKEMSLLRANTRSAILVHRATLHSLTWQELDELQANHQSGRETK